MSGKALAESPCLRRPWNRLAPPWGLVILLAVAAGEAAGQDEDDERPTFQRGLVGEYIGADGKSHKRVDELLSFVWNQSRPDPRLPGAKFSVSWRGRLFSIESGEYRLHVFAAGAVKITLENQVILDRQSMRREWMSSEPVKLNYGHHPLKIEYRKTSAAASISLFWQGPKFAIEPVPARHLFHDLADAPQSRVENGRRLTQALRCAACHRIPGHSPPRPAPALDHLAGNVDPAWLVQWIQRANHGSIVPGAEKPADNRANDAIHRMPSFALKREEAEAMAAYLLSASKKTLPAKLPAKTKKRSNKKRSRKKTSGKKSDKKRQPDAGIGRELFVTIGCLACHRVDKLGSDGLFGGGDLSSVAQKRPADFFMRWLADPAKTNPDHRMPVFRLDREELDDLAAFLNTLKAAKPKDADARPKKGFSAEEKPQRAARGRELILKNRCHACHRIPGDAPAPGKWRLSSLSRDSQWGASCLGEADRKKIRPGFHLPKQARNAIHDYISSLAKVEKQTVQRIDGRMVLDERNCLGCHARGQASGITAQFPSILKAFGKLAPLLPAMKPPALFGVGDKLHEQALHDAIAAKGEPLRPWLKIRMPRFDLSAEESRALVHYFVNTDRVPRLTADLRPTPPRKTPQDAAAFRIAGSRLVTAAGFGCTSCHPIGSAMPGKVELKSQGPDLAMLGKRVRRSWYDRWMPNPSRIAPNMEMPSLVLPVRGVLEDRLDEQLAAVWHVLNEPDFKPPRPGAIRIVRCRNVAGQPERARVITDVLEIGEMVYIKPLLIGLPNRHNVLFDLETNQLVGWWIGDTARQRTRGKSWYWEPGGTPLFTPGDGDSELKQYLGKKLKAPLASGQFVTEFDSLQHIKGGIRFSYRLRFAAKKGKEPLTVRVTQTITAMGGSVAKKSEASSLSGFSRQIEVKPVGFDFEYDLRLAPPGVFKNPLTWRYRTAGDVNKESRLHAKTAQFEIDARHQEGQGRSTKLHVAYLTKLPVDSFPVIPPPPPSPPAQPLRIAPGFDAVQLPLSDEIMPTGLAWREDGTLVVASLKGRVWLGRDTDGDGLEDKLTPFSDVLAAPYGVAVHDGAIDVVNKYALLRLFDDDDDGRADRTVTLASGWGHTRDYHDWVVGLLNDRADNSKAGNYYIALPCQQDARSLAAASYRGKALRLVPRRPTVDDPRLYRIEVICGGLRFPMGLARNREGALFATDNQGNYNPFNELNHLRPGRRYGFINKTEFRPNFKPPLTPPAIDIPHPWTRSVNGITFLDTPKKLREKLGRDLYGPFEGHLIGCEYDTKRLIRMSLQKVGDTYQGAAYPFTVDPPKGSPGLQGPIVCAVAPDGDLYIGNIHDSGWGGGANVGSLVRLRPKSRASSIKLPAGIAEVRVTDGGFAIDFTAPVDRRLASQLENYAIASYRRISTPAYGGKDQDRATAAIHSVKISADAIHAFVKLDKLRTGFVYEIRLKNLAPDGGLFHPAEAFYTLRRLP